LVIVFDGEIVIPAEFNPLYTKPINKKKQKINEANAVNRYFGSFDTGGVIEDPMGRVKEFGSKLKDNSVDIMKGLFAKDETELGPDMQQNVHGEQIPLDETLSGTDNVNI
jgi:hypothetical protein